MLSLVKVRQHSMTDISHSLLKSCLTAAEGKHNFLVDHNIGGRVLMPATSYVCTAWEAAATKAGKEMKEFPVEFRDVQIHQAVVVTDSQKITLAVQITPDNHFYVRLLSSSLNMPVQLRQAPSGHPI